MDLKLFQVGILIEMRSYSGIPGTLCALAASLNVKSSRVH